jgi:hypothetical protein
MSQIQPGPPSDPPGLKTGLLVIVGLVVLAVVGGVVYLATNDSDGGSGGGSSPEDAVVTFFEAAKAADCDRFVDSVTKDSRVLMANDFDVDAEPKPVSRADVVSLCEENADTQDFADTRLVSTKTTSNDGNTARVEVTIETEGDRSTDEVPVILEEGEWRVDMVQLVDEIGVETRGS